SAAGRPVAPEQARGRHRDFDQALVDAVLESRRIRCAVVIVPDRIDARAVAIAGPADALECPGRVASDREARRTVAFHFDIGDGLEADLRKLDVREERLGRLPARAPVRKAVARELVSRAYDRAHDRRVALGDPAKREERRLRTVLVEQREDALDVAFD